MLTGTNKRFPISHCPSLTTVRSLAMPLLRKRDVAGLLMLLAVFIAIGVLRLPLQVVLLVGIPLSLLVTWFLRRRGAT